MSNDAPPTQQRSTLDADVHDFGFHADHADATVARDRFSSWLGEWCADNALVQELRTVFGELAANAVEATPAGRDAIVASAWCEGDDLVLAVTNWAPVPGQDIEHWDMNDPLRAGGRGLLIARAYTDALVVDAAQGAITVRCRRRFNA